MCLVLGFTGRKTVHRLRGDEGTLFTFPSRSSVPRTLFILPVSLLAPSRQTTGSRTERPRERFVLDLEFMHVHECPEQVHLHVHVHDCTAIRYPNVHHRVHSSVSHSSTVVELCIRRTVSCLGSRGTRCSEIVTLCTA